MEFTRLRPSPSMAVALAALMVALSGTAVAATIAKNSVTSAAVKNGEIKRADIARNAIDSSRVADGSLRAVDFAAGQLPAGAKGDTGPAGPAGPAGAAGAAGANGANGVSGHQVVQASGTTIVAFTGESTGTATCPAGKKVVGGGVRYVQIVAGTTPDPPRVTASFPTATGDGWTGAVRGTHNEDWGSTIYAICATV